MSKGPKFFPKIDSFLKSLSSHGRLYPVYALNVGATQPKKPSTKVLLWVSVTPLLRTGHWMTILSAQTGLLGHA